MLNENFVLIGIIVQFFAGVGYVIDTIKGKVKPNRVSWFLWCLAPLIAFFAEINQGVGIQSLTTFIVGFVPFLIFIASFVNKKSYWQLGKLDYICGALSLLGLFLWILTKTGNIAILFSLFADLLASIPTIIKSYQDPESESAWVFGAGIFMGGLTLFTIRQWNFATYAYPIYLTIMNSLIFSFIQFKLGKYLSKK